MQDVGLQAVRGRGQARGEGLGNFLTYGDFPSHGRDDPTSWLIPSGAILNRDLSTILPHITRLGLYGSGVLYDPERFTQNTWALLVFDINPIYQFLMLTRWCIIDIEVNWWFWITGPAYALALLTVGVIYFWRGETTYGATT